MKPEKKLLKKFRLNCENKKDFEIISLELYNRAGFPDLLIRTLDKYKLCELKYVAISKKRPAFSSFQILHATLNGSVDNVLHRNFLLIEYENKPQPEAVHVPRIVGGVYLYDSNQINKLINDPLTATPLAVNDWQLIKKIISG
jgi:hypothetical protein|tara:strand:- start:444 stop:872 length:429 start_codon:yes stop_codon:yes gene_type:complete